jgi:hypothetical protein
MALLLLTTLWIVSLIKCSNTINYMVKVGKCELFYKKQRQFTFYSTHNIPINDNDIRLFGCSWQHYLFKKLIQSDNKCCPSTQCDFHDNLCHINKTPVNGLVHIQYDGLQYQCQVWLLKAHKVLKKCASCFMQHCQTLRACYYGFCY